MEQSSVPPELFSKINNKLFEEEGYGSHSQILIPDKGLILILTAKWKITVIDIVSRWLRTGAQLYLYDIQKDKFKHLPIQIYKNTEVIELNSDFTLLSGKDASEKIVFELKTEDLLSAK